MGDIGKIVKSLGFIEEFVEVTSSLSTERDIENLLDKVIQSACRFTHCDGGRIYMLDVTRQHLELRVSYWDGQPVDNSWFEPCSLIQDSRTKDGFTNTEPLIYSTITGSIFIVDDVVKASSFNTEKIHLHDQLNGVKTHAFILVPLINHEGQIVGILELINARDSKYNRYVSFKPLETVIKAFASQAAICINNTLLIDSNQKLIDILDTSNRALEDENQRLRANKNKKNHYRIIGQSPSMRKVFSLMDKVVESNVTVLLRGETGTGKEVFARAIHEHSQRKNKAFVTQNCAALPEQLLESELFGYKKGAFTGAVGERKGLFDVANGGTLFLDEIGDMPISLQSKLLRVLQESEIRPLGAMHSHKVDVRIVAATHCNLEEKIRKGEFREDLYFRLSVFPLELPALKVRGDDIILLVQHFIGLCERQYGRQIRGISPSAIKHLVSYDYPGNVRELQNIIERAVLLCDDGSAILPEYLPENIRKKNANDHTERTHLELPIPAEAGSLKKVVNDFECSLIKEHLKINNWNQTQTAKALQIPRRTLIDKMTRFKIKTPDRRKRA